MKCLVSGATGFIGRELCRVLGERNIDFLALSRCGGHLVDGGTTTAVNFESQVIDPRLLGDIDVVFHLAGIAHRNAISASYSKVNYRATLRLARAAAKAGVKCFVYLSSVKAMGPPLNGEVRDETLCNPPRDAYGQSKIQAEQELEAEFSQSEMSVVVLRPTLVYGSVPKGNLAALRKAIRLGLPRPPELGGRSMVALPDLVELMLQIVKTIPPGFHTWIVSDGQRYSSRRIYELMRSADGKGRGASWLPLPLWKLAAWIADGMREKGSDSTYNKLFGTELYSSARVQQSMAWRPRLQLSDLVGEMMNAPGRKVS